MTIMDEIQTLIEYFRDDRTVQYSPNTLPDGHVQRHRVVDRSNLKDVHQEFKKKLSQKMQRNLDRDIGSGVNRRRT